MMVWEKTDVEGPKPIPLPMPFGFQKGGAFLKEKAETKKGGGLAGLKKRGENRLALGKGLAKI